MDRRGEHAPVVVGVDDEGCAGDAVDWAAAEAAARGCPLQLLHAFHPPLPADPYGVVPPIDGFFASRTAAELVLRDAAARARSVSGDIEVSTRLVPGTATRALLGEARHAQMLVLGVRGRFGLRDLLTGSVPVHVAAHAPCPVVAIHPAGDQNLGTSAPRVVVGVDGTPSCTAAVTFAFHAARQRGIPLTVVHAWTPDAPADLESVSGPAAMAEAEGRRALEHALRRGRDEFADIPVVTTLVRADPLRALIAEADGAALLVVGSRGRGHILGTVLGSVSQSVLDHVRCPIAIVRHHATTPAELRTAEPAAGEHPPVPETGSIRPARRQVFRIRRPSR
jgi:nucleotide-binding universal stress UspA family protein